MTNLDKTVKNVYCARESVVSSSILDSLTNEVGTFLIKRHVSSMALFGQSNSTMPDVETVKGPQELVSRLKKSKGVTIKRITNQQHLKPSREEEKLEHNRMQFVKREISKIECMSSKMNSCQAIVKPDCSKAKVQKSIGVKNGLKAAFVACFDQAGLAKFKEVVTLDTSNIPEVIKTTVKCVTVEFAGVKFKFPSNITAPNYIAFIEKSFFLKMFINFPHVKQIAVCEEKYLFTPDDFKAATRVQRGLNKKYEINHLKTSEEILAKFEKSDVTGSKEGKQLISTYLAANISDVNLRKNVVVDIDSELHVSECKTFTTPIRCTFSSESGLVSVDKLDSIRQSKGEAELSQIDWLIEYSTKLNPGEAVASLVTSGDIDAVLLHMFAVSLFGKKNEERKFLNPVYVILQKPNSLFDIFNITALIEILQDATQDHQIGTKLAVALSLGGNDYLPKFHGITHTRFVEVILDNFRDTFLNFSENSITINSAAYIEIIKTVYCPKYLLSKSFTFEQIID